MKCRKIHSIDITMRVFVELFLQMAETWEVTQKPNNREFDKEMML